MNVWHMWISTWMSDTCEWVIGRCLWHICGTTRVCIEACGNDEIPPQKPLTRVWLDSSPYVTWLILAQGRAETTRYAPKNIYRCVTWLIHVCDMTNSHVWHDSFTYVSWLVLVQGRAQTTKYPPKKPSHMCEMTHSYVWHESFTCVTWLIHTCDMTHSNVCRDSFLCRGVRKWRQETRQRTSGRACAAIFITS